MPPPLKGVPGASKTRLLDAARTLAESIWRDTGHEAVHARLQAIRERALAEGYELSWHLANVELLRELVRFCLLRVVNQPPCKALFTAEVLIVSEVNEASQKKKDTLLLLQGMLGVTAKDSLSSFELRKSSKDALQRFCKQFCQTAREDMEDLVICAAALCQGDERWLVEIEKANADQLERIRDLERQFNEQRRSKANEMRDAFAEKLVKDLGKIRSTDTTREPFLAIIMARNILCTIRDHIGSWTGSFAIDEILDGMSARSVTIRTPFPLVSAAASPTSDAAGADQYWLKKLGALPVRDRVVHVAHWLSESEDGSCSPAIAHSLLLSVAEDVSAALRDPALELLQLDDIVWRRFDAGWRRIFCEGANLHQHLWSSHHARLCLVGVLLMYNTLASPAITFGSTNAMLATKVMEDYQLRLSRDGAETMIDVAIAVAAGACGGASAVTFELGGIATEFLVRFSFLTLFGQHDSNALRKAYQAAHLGVALLKRCAEHDWSDPAVVDCAAWAARFLAVLPEAIIEEEGASLGEFHFDRAGYGLVVARCADAIPLALGKCKLAPSSDPGRRGRGGRALLGATGMPRDLALFVGHSCRLLGEQHDALRRIATAAGHRGLWSVSELPEGVRTAIQSMTPEFPAPPREFHPGAHWEPPAFAHSAVAPGVRPPVHEFHPGTRWEGSETQSTRAPNTFASTGTGHRGYTQADHLNSSEWLDIEADVACQLPQASQPAESLPEVQPSPCVAPPSSGFADARPSATELHAQVAHLTQEPDITALREENARLRDEVAALKVENAQLRMSQDELQTRLERLEAGASLPGR